jgi:phosphoribosylaminoimidazolecarboxamide formyltransferase/IMP cyclohydrolase
MFRTALVSVSDKTGIVEFLRPLVKQGLKVISTGGTSRHLRDHHIPVTEISEYTGFPEVMDGRVRTLHPRVHMALLARGDAPEDMQLLKDQGLDPIDLLVVNLYPFEQAYFETENERELVDEIDIGGPALLRASAKNFGRVTVICDPKDYAMVGQTPDLTYEQRRHLASKVFAHTAAYDAMISREFLNSGHERFALGGEHVLELRYGENPQQTANWYRRLGARHGLHQAEIIQGKPLSYNNLLDLNAAVLTLREFQTPAAVAVKHNNPCGVAEGTSLTQAVRQALQADPVSVFGGIVAVNRPLQAVEAELLSPIFLECVIAPQVSSEARAIFAKKKNLRILEWSDLLKSENRWDLKMIEGGFLVQSLDQVQDWQTDWQVVGAPIDDAKIRADLIFAWKTCAHLKSNAIVIAEAGQSLGLGMGQVNRIEAVAHAIERMRRHHAQAQRPVLASDAFFPFPDSIEVLAEAGVRYVIQPGGSIKDDEVIRAATRLGVTMVLTGRRHFQH